MRWSLASVLLALSIGGQQACKGSAECLRHTDCTRQELCDLGTCVMKPTEGSGLGDAGAGDSSGQATTGGRVNASGGKASSGGQNARTGGTVGDAGGAGGAAGSAGAGS